MNRKNFLSSIMPLTATLHAPAGRLQDSSPEHLPIIPPYLDKGAAIGIACPADYITREEIQPAVSKLKEWGFEVVIGNTIGKKDFNFGGTDEERLKDLQMMMDDEN